MSRASARKKQQAATNQTQQTVSPIPANKMTTDAFQNVLARMGWGMPSMLEATDYPLTRLTKNYQLMNSLYRSHWIVRRIIDVIPEDMCKNWYQISSQMKPDAIERIQKLERRTSVRRKILKALKWGRLYGGAGAILMVDGHENMLNQPLDLKSVMPSSYKGLLVVDRWSGITPGPDLVTDINDPEFGLPNSYQVTNNANGMVFNIHHSRVLRFIGRDLPNWEEQAETYWGASEIEHVFDELKKRDNTSYNIANLVFRANLNVLTMEGMEEVLAIGNEQAQRDLYNTVQAQNWLLNNFSMYILGKNDKFDAKQYTFSGLSDVYECFMMDVAGAAEIPITKLFGRSPAGLNATGESDLQNYYDTIEEKQEAHLRSALDKLLPVMFVSEFGAMPDDFDYKFNSVRRASDEEQAELAGKTVGSIIQVFNAGLISERVALKELRQSEEKTGMWSNITDEDIERASDQPNPVGESVPDMGILSGSYPGANTMPEEIKAATGKTAQPESNNKPTSVPPNNEKLSLLDKLKYTVDALTGIIRSKTIDGGAGSGNFGHKGRPGKLGGSGEGGVSEPELKESIIEALLSHETAGYPESSRGKLEARTTKHLMNSYGEMIKKHGPSKKEEVSKVAGMIEEFKGEGKKEPSAKSTKEEYIEAILKMEPDVHTREGLAKSSLSMVEEYYEKLAKSRGIKEAASKFVEKSIGKETKADPEAKAKALKAGVKLPKSVATMWKAPASDIYSVAKYAGIEKPEEYTRFGVSVKAAFELAEKKGYKDLADDLIKRYPAPRKAPESVDAIKDMDPAELAFRAKIMGVDGWDVLGGKSLKAALIKAYSVTPPDSAVVKSVEPVVPKGETAEKPVPKLATEPIRGQDSFMRRHVPRADIEASYDIMAERKIKEYSAKYGLSREEYIGKLNEKLQDMVDKCDVKMRVRKNVLEQFILHNGGRLKNQFETGTSGGCLSSKYRSNLENQLWSIHREADGASRPVYGYAYSEEMFDKRGPGGVGFYGDIALTFKPEIKHRTTISAGDTLNNVKEYSVGLIPRPITAVNYKMLNASYAGLAIHNPLEKGVNLDDLKTEYWECQIFGPTTIQDIAHVSFLGHPKPDSKITKRLDELG
ncbi:MAG: anti-CBASS protein Acb1 family protein, partial [Coriobacteriia bacterium]